ncbi:MAG: hypothetical protein V4553_09880 [Bacteroidota bacterium]
MKTRFALLIIAILLFVFVCLGYWMSDDKFYSAIITKNNLHTPHDVFTWVNSEFSTKSYMYYHPNASPRHLIEKHTGLWCDEGAIVMATLDHKLGYETRLIDLYGYDNISHHTILQVYEKDKWVNYDFTFKLNNQDLTKSSDSFNLKLKEGRVKKYPKFYNFVVNNNFFAQKIIFKIRGISNTEPQSHKLNR